MCLRWLIVCFLCGRYNISHFYKDRLRPLCPMGKIFHTLFKNLVLVLWYLSNEYKRVEWLPVPKMSNTDDQIFLTKKQCSFFLGVRKNFGLCYLRLSENWYLLFPLVLCISFCPLKVFAFIFKRMQQKRKLNWVACLI